MEVSLKAEFSVFSSDSDPVGILTATSGESELEPPGSTVPRVLTLPPPAPKLGRGGGARNGNGK